MNNLLLLKLKKLIQSNAVSGYECEMEITNTIESLVKKKSKYIDDNLIYKFGMKGKKVLISAHMDEVGFFITKVFDKYFTIIPIGEIDIENIIGEKLVFSVNG